MRRASRARAEHLGEHRHAHRDAVAHLVADHRLRAVGDLGGDLDAAVHRLRVHDDRVRARRLRRSRVSPQARKYASPSGRSASPMRSFWMRSIITTSRRPSPAPKSV